MIEKLYELRELVDDEDIPHPTVPEYVEHHASIQKILAAIDDIIASLTGSNPATPQLLDHKSKSVFAINNVIRRPKMSKPVNIQPPQEPRCPLCSMTASEKANYFVALLDSFSWPEEANQDHCYEALRTAQALLYDEAKISSAAKMLKACEPDASLEQEMDELIATSFRYVKRFREVWTPRNYEVSANKLVTLEMTEICSDTSNDVDKLEGVKLTLKILTQAKHGPDTPWTIEQWCVVCVTPQNRKALGISTNDYVNDAIIKLSRAAGLLNTASMEDDDDECME